jgi:hypothetical protein
VLFVPRTKDAIDGVGSLDDVGGSIEIRLANLEMNDALALTIEGPAFVHNHSEDTMPTYQFAQSSRILSAVIVAMHRGLCQCVPDADLQRRLEPRHLDLLP